MAPSSVILQATGMAIISVVLLLFYLSLYLTPGREEIYHPRRQRGDQMLLSYAEEARLIEERKASGNKRGIDERLKALSRSRDKVDDALFIGLDSMAWLTCALSRLSIGGELDGDGSFQQCAVLLMLLSAIGGLGVMYADLQCGLAGLLSPDLPFTVTARRQFETRAAHQGLVDRDAQHGQRRRTAECAALHPDRWRTLTEPQSGCTMATRSICPSPAASRSTSISGT
jgi:hypothetical protein